MTPIELLSPAKDLECGKAAIDNGADAVYIGGPSFGARAAAGNSFTDIEGLTRYAHRFRAKVYLTLNTILFDDELDSARMIARQAWDAGVDALIIQDMGLRGLICRRFPLLPAPRCTMRMRPISGFWNRWGSGAPYWPVSLLCADPRNPEQYDNRA